jgi:hypothetical protein
MAIALTVTFTILSRHHGEVRVSEVDELQESGDFSRHRGDFDEKPIMAFIASQFDVFAAGVSDSRVRMNHLLLVRRIQDVAVNADRQ